MTKKKSTKNPPQEKKKRGPKPIVFSEEKIKHVERLAGNCMKVPEICAILNISESAFYNCAKKQPEIMEALKRGRAQTTAAIADSLIKAAKKGDYKSQAFYLSRQAGWIDKQEQAPPSEITFVVEMNEDGKFKHSRPRQIEESSIDVDFEEVDDTEPDNG